MFTGAFQYEGRIQLTGLASYIQFNSSLCKAPYHSNFKSYTDLGQLNCGVFRSQVHLILITKKTGTSEEQTSGFNHEYQ